jgi:hypothetical protein
MDADYCPPLQKVIREPFVADRRRAAVISCAGFYMTGAA